MIRRLALALTALALAGAAEPASYQSSPERRTVTDERDWGQWLGPFRQKLVPSLMQDFGERYLYAPADAALPPPKPGERRVVFLGDSITDKWNLAAYFPGQPYINRGIGSQVTAQMLVRFQQDVVALHPSAVVILGGVNDVQGVLQIETPDGIVGNIEAMADIADAHHIKVVLCSILPVNNYTPAAQNVLKERSPALLAQINERLRALAKARHYAYADYGPVLRDDKGLMAAPYTTDGIHPTAAGYERMVPVVKEALAHSLP
jgi:lysophospholipase L1-like esterase